MAEYAESKCKNCGAPIDPSTAHNGVLTCTYCLSEFTLPKPETDPAALEYLRQGEHELDTGSFDRAYAAFDKAAEYAPAEPEAYFGMALSVNKVRYIKDIKSNDDSKQNRLQPICYEINTDLFTQDKNYLRALRLATDEQKEVYTKCGEEIDCIRKEFFNLQRQGVDYDCFICVKVSDDERKTADGKKVFTTDYDTADKLYYYLRGKGYKPFFSERDIGNRTGADYETLILYALYKSECMLVICSNETYLQTPWVKNEYSRFLKLVNDEVKESDSIAIVYNGKPIEKLPGRKGKLQGVDSSKGDAYEKVVAFVDKHTPEFQQKREEERRRKQAEAEEQKRLLDELRKQSGSKKYCTSCGKENAQDAKFCNSCGKGEFVNTHEEYAAIVRKRIEDELRKKLTQEKKASREKAAQEREAAREKTKAEKEKRILDEWQMELLGSVFQLEKDKLVRYMGRASSVVIPNGVTSIGDEAFCGCSSLTNVTVPDSVTSIGNKAFYGCTRLKSITIPGSVKEIGEDAFYNIDVIIRTEQIAATGQSTASPLSDFVIEDDVLKKYRGKGGNVVIPFGVRSIWWDAFRDCNNVTSIEIPGSVGSISGDAFVDCSNLTSIKIAEGITSIERNVFAYCRNLTSIELPNSVTCIKEWAFYGCSSLTSITIPNGVRSIEERTFACCSSLANIDIPDSVKKIGKGAFYGTKLTKEDLPKRFQRYSGKYFKL